MSLAVNFNRHMFLWRRFLPSVFMAERCLVAGERGSSGLKPGWSDKASSGGSLYRLCALSTLTPPLGAVLRRLFSVLLLLTTALQPLVCFQITNLVWELCWNLSLPAVCLFGVCLSVPCTFSVLQHLERAKCELRWQYWIHSTAPCCFEWS